MSIEYPSVDLTPLRSRLPLSPDSLLLPQHLQHHKTNFFFHHFQIYRSLPAYFPGILSLKNLLLKIQQSPSLFYSPEPLYIRFPHRIPFQYFSKLLPSVFPQHWYYNHHFSPGSRQEAPPFQASNLRLRSIKISFSLFHLYY